MINFKTNTKGFTIVEIIVVIGLIGIIASITIVSYGGVKRSMVAAQMEADLRTAAVQLSADFSKDSKFPDTKELANGGKGITASVGITFTYLYDDLTNKYCLAATDSNGVSYHIKSDIKSVVAGDCSVPVPPVEEPPVVTPVPTDSVALGGALSDSATDMVKTTDGGYVVTGSTANNTAGGNDMFIAKFAADDSLVWGKTWGGTGDDYGYALAQSADDSLAVLGKTNSFGSDNCLFVAKFTAAGAPVWDKGFGSVDCGSPSDIAATSDGGYLITGDGFYEVSNWDIFTAKLSSTGTLSWFKKIGSATMEYSGPVIETTDGKYLSVGETAAGTNGRQVSITKYQTNGNSSWSETWGSKYNESISDVAATPDGGAIMVGYRAGVSGVSDGLIVKIDSTGGVTWNKIWGGTGSEGFSSVILTSDGGYLATGSTSSYGAGDRDMLLVKFNADGTLAWNKTWGGTAFDNGASLIQTASGSYVVVGTTQSFGTGGDIFIAKYTSDGVLANCVALLCQTPVVTLSTLSTAAVGTAVASGLMTAFQISNITVTPGIFSPSSGVVNTF